MDANQALQREIKEAVEAVAAHPSSIRAKQKLADLYLQAEQIKDVIAVYISMAEEHVSRDQAAAGAAVYKQMLRAIPEAAYIEGYKRLGELYLSLERSHDAAEQWLRYSELCEAADAHSEASWALEQVDVISTLGIPARIRLAELYAEQGLSEQAVVAYTDVLDRLEEKMYWSDYTKAASRLLMLAPNHLPTRKMLARLAIEQGEVMESVRHLQHAFRIDRRDPETLEMLSLAFDFLGQERKSLSVLKELADVYEAQSQLARARTVYRTILERDPKSKTAAAALTHLQVLAGLQVADPESASPLLADGPEEPLDTDDSDLSLFDQPDDAQSSPSPDDATSLGDGFAAPMTSIAIQLPAALQKETPAEEEEEDEFTGLREELLHCNVPIELMNPTLIRQILRRKRHAGRVSGRWPSIVRRRLDGELLYEDRYLVTDYLGKGMFGKTYRAIDLASPTQFVCIKRPYFEEFSEEQEAQFCNLFVSLLTPMLDLTHPHLIRTLAVGQTELGYPYLVSEYFAGRSLVESAQLSSVMICEIWYRLIHTLSYLHSVGQLHGNLNPKNVMLADTDATTDSGFQLRLLDAGLGVVGATIDDVIQVESMGREMLSSGSMPSIQVGPGRIRGTRGFIAPELLEGAELSPASEVFALGCLLFYMATKQPPPWGQEQKVSDPLLHGITRSANEETPALVLGDDPHSRFLQSLFPQLVAFVPDERLCLRDIQRLYVQFVSNDTSGSGEAAQLPDSFVVEDTDMLQRSPMFRVDATPQNPAPQEVLEQVDDLQTKPFDEITDTQHTDLSHRADDENDKEDESDDAEPSHPLWSKSTQPDESSGSMSLPPLVAPPTPHAEIWRPPAAKEEAQEVLGLLDVPDDSSLRTQLPAACASLSAETQSALVQLQLRMKHLQLFSGKGDPLLGVEFLQEHVRRLQCFSRFPLTAHISYVRTNWHVLQQHLATQEEVDEIARKASESILKEDPNDLDRAGQIAWSAIDQFTFSQSRLLPFKTAISAVSGIGWSPEQASEWSAATTEAKSMIKQHAQQAGLLEAWNAAKSMAWCLIWPLAKAAAVRAFHPLAHAATWPISWDASWHTAWTAMQGIEGVAKDPFEPFFAVWEMGLYPLQLHDGGIILIVLDPQSDEQFEPIHMN